MKIIAQRNENVYMLVEDGVDEIEADTEGRVLDDRNELLYPYTDANSLVARGYWEEFDGDQSILDPMLDDAKEVTY